MTFSQNEISGVLVQTDGPELFIRWTTSAPQGTVFQLYVDGRLSWYGAARGCYAPIPFNRQGRNIWVDVATVDPEEASIDFSAKLASRSSGGPPVRLTWSGGTYLDPTGADDIKGFRVYGSAAPGAALNWSSPIDVVPAYPGGWVCDGFGLGGFGDGGFGRSSGSYSWSPTGLSSGVWNFSIVPYDHAGNNRGSGQSVVVNVIAAPLPPAISSSGIRLGSSYSGPESRQVTLEWLPSPSS